MPDMTFPSSPFGYNCKKSGSTAKTVGAQRKMCMDDISRYTYLQLYGIIMNDVLRDLYLSFQI